MAKFILAPFALCMCISAHLIQQDQQRLHIGANMTTTSFGDIPPATPEIHRLPKWQIFANEYSGGTAFSSALESACATLVADLSLPPDAVAEFCQQVTALCYVESGLHHFDDDGNVKTGDRGLAVGVGQLHPLWGTFYDLDRHTLRDNVEMCARVLLRGGWTPDHVNKQTIAMGYYNTGTRRIYRRYSDKVWAAWRMIEAVE